MPKISWNNQAQSFIACLAMSSWNWHFLAKQSLLCSQICEKSIVDQNFMTMYGIKEGCFSSSHERGTKKKF